MSLPSFFISYRRSDVPGHAGRLYDRLADRFGEANVFMDLDSLEPGVDYAKVIQATIARCDALLAVIGPGWLHAGDEAERRLDDPDDWVRLEIASALQREMRVVPVLVRGATLPAAEDLPHAIRDLVRRHAVALSDEIWRAQVTQFTEMLAKGRPTSESPEADPSTHQSTAAGPAQPGEKADTAKKEPLRSLPSTSDVFRMLPRS
jgi:cell division septation protein DedD